MTVVENLYDSSEEDLPFQFPFQSNSSIIENPNINLKDVNIDNIKNNESILKKEKVSNDKSVSVLFDTITLWP